MSLVEIVRSCSGTNGGLGGDGEDVRLVTVLHELHRLTDVVRDLARGADEHTVQRHREQDARSTKDPGRVAAEA